MDDIEFVNEFRRRSTDVQQLCMAFMNVHERCEQAKAKKATRRRKNRRRNFDDDDFDVIENCVKKSSTKKNAFMKAAKLLGSTFDSVSGYYYDKRPCKT